MIRMATIWDRTTEVIAGRTGILASIAALTVFLPGLVRAGWAAFATPGSATALVVGGLISLILGVVTIWGTLALVAVASDPATDRSAALRQGARRLLPAIGLALLLLLLLVVLAIPAVLLLGVAGFNWTAAVAGAAQTGVSAGGAGGFLLYVVVLLVFALWLTARLALWNPVIVNERRGVGTFARSFELTRGLTWRLIGVILLFGLVVGIAALAAQAVFGILLRLIAGQAAGLFFGAAAASVVSTGATVISSVFTAQLYRAQTGQEAAAAFE